MQFSYFFIIKRMTTKFFNISLYFVTKIYKKNCNVIFVHLKKIVHYNLILLILYCICIKIKFSKIFYLKSLVLNN